MRIQLTSVFVDDQEKALRFYTDLLGFVKKQDLVMEEARWLTIASPEDPDGVELILEPDNNAATQTFKQAIREEGIPFMAFAVDDLKTEYERLKALGVVFTQGPTKTGPAAIALFDDTCGNLLQIYQV